MFTSSQLFCVFVFHSWIHCFVVWALSSHYTISVLYFRCRLSRLWEGKLVHSEVQRSYGLHYAGWFKSPSERNKQTFLWFHYHHHWAEDQGTRETGRQPGWLTDRHRQTDSRQRLASHCDLRRCIRLRCNRMLKKNIVQVFISLTTEQICTCNNGRRDAWLSSAKKKR